MYFQKECVKCRSIVHEKCLKGACCDVAGHLVRREHEFRWRAAGSVTHNLCIVIQPESCHLSVYKTILESITNIKDYINLKTKIPDMILNNQTDASPDDFIAGIRWKDTVMLCSAWGALKPKEIVAWAVTGWWCMSVSIYNKEQSWHGWTPMERWEKHCPALFIHTTTFVDTHLLAFGLIAPYCT